MQELLIVNPSRRPSKRRKSSKAASPAQKRARAKFAAMARARAGTKRRASPKRKSARRRSAAPALMANPRSRRRSVAKRRRNPVSRIGGKGMVKKAFALISPALMGAGGALIVNNVLARLPLPAAAMQGRMRYVTQGVAAVAIAAIAQKMGVKGSTAAQMAEGSLTVTLYDAIKDVAAGAGVNLSGGMGYYLPGVGARNAIPSPSASAARMAGGMGKYVTGPGARGNVMQMNGMRQKTRSGGGFGF